jgi:tetratricopeptide (TPR) repeat protein
LELFRGKDAVNDYERLVNRAQQVGDRELDLEFLLGLAHAYYLVSLDDPEMHLALKCRELYDVAQSLARELGNKRIRISSLLAPRMLMNFWPEYREQFATQAQEALALSRELGDEELIVQCKVALFVSASALGVAEMEQALLEELHAWRDLIRLNDVYFVLMMVHYALGNFDRMAVCCDAGIEIAGKIGVPPVQYPTLKALALLGLGRYGAAWEALQHEVADDAHPFGQAYKELGFGIYLFELAAYAQAAAIFEQLVVQAERLRRRWLRDWAHLMLARTLLRTTPVGRNERLRVAQALADIDVDVQKLNERMGHPALGLATRAELLLVNAEPGAALQEATEAVALATARGLKSQVVVALEVQARVLLQLQRPNEALSISEIAQSITVEIKYLPMLWRVYATKANALQELGQAPAADQAWQSAAAIIQRLADTITDKDLQKGFLSDPRIGSIIACAQKQNGSKERK